MKQVARSWPRIVSFAGSAGTLVALTIILIAWQASTGQLGSVAITGAIVCVFFLYVFVRALLSRVEFDEQGGTYHGLVRTRSWRWKDAAAVGRQRGFVVGSTGSTPAIQLADGTEIVLVGLSDPKHPDAEDALIGRMASFVPERPTAEQVVDALRAQRRPDSGAGTVA